MSFLAGAPTPPTLRIYRRQRDARRGGDDTKGDVPRTPASQEVRTFIWTVYVQMGGCKCQRVTGSDFILFPFLIRKPAPMIEPLFA